MQCVTTGAACPGLPRAGDVSGPIEVQAVFPDGGPTHLAERNASAGSLRQIGTLAQLACTNKPPVRMTRQQLTRNAKKKPPHWVWKTS